MKLFKYIFFPLFLGGWGGGERVEMILKIAQCFAWDNCCMLPSWRKLKMENTYLHLLVGLGVRSDFTSKNEDKSLYHITSQPKKISSFTSRYVKMRLSWDYHIWMSQMTRVRDNTVSWRHVKKTNRNPIPECEDGKLYNALQFKKFFDKETIWSPFLTKKKYPE